MTEQEDKKLIRYRDGKIVSTKGERFSQVTVPRVERQVLTDTKTPTLQSLSHCQNSHTHNKTVLSPNNLDRKKKMKMRFVF